MQTDGKLYLLHLSIHGLIRGHDLELGRDADTGGQTQYVVELARALADCPDVERIDLATRRVVDAKVSDDYAQPVEKLADGARLVRIEAGPDEYIAKEQLWDHLDSFHDNLLDWLREQPRMPDVVHSHYPDAAYVAVRLANLLGVPLVHTGHSLGRDKRQRLLAKGVPADVVEDTYNISRRIAAEEEVLANADLVVTSTSNEIENQYELYDYYDPDRMVVIPPGVDLDRFRLPQDGEQFSFAEELRPFLRDPDKPLITALSRPDERKNIASLLEAYGESAALQEAANLLIIAGNREDITELNSGAQAVLTDLLLLIDRYDLYGRVAMPKHHRPVDVPEIYRITAASGGVFVNPALTEPFGLTLLEAAASGCPIVATENGGPVDIIANCSNGKLVDPLNPDEIATAISDLLDDRAGWRKAAENGIQGVREHYTWQAHARRYLERIERLEGRHRPLLEETPRTEARHPERAIFSDLDQNLLGDLEALPPFIEVMRKHRQRVSFGVATGRRIDSALAVMKKAGIPRPDILISSLGTRIHYGPELTEDEWWSDHIDRGWNRPRIRRALEDIPGLKLQDRVEQSKFKISYYYDPELAPPVEDITTLLHQADQSANVIGAFGQFLDIVPSRASKGRALRYVALKFDFPLDRILVAGGSGADEDMMRGNSLAVVVANRHNEELSQLVDLDRVYFAKEAYALGILEAIEHYGFLDD
ncbi:MAG: HAD-IIB family hydrolase [Xanthomonadales bacterium]|nr:HAD-IIB family hydrolase [Xanthomonadales bacterium]